MADVEPVGKQLHRRLHLLGDEKILDGFRHPPATESGEGKGVGGAQGGSCHFRVPKVMLCLHPTSNCA